MITPQTTKIKKQIKKGNLTYYWLQRPEFDGSQKCAGFDTDSYYPVAFIDQGEIKVLKKICEGCPFKQPCQEYALVHESYGFWGGTTPPERERIRKVIGWGLVPVEYINDFFFNGDARVGQGWTKLT
jgi:hypothetical protein